MKNLISYLLILMLFAVVSCNRHSSDASANDEQADGNSGSDIEALTKRIKRDTANAGLYQQRALEYLELRDPNKAMRDMLTAIQLDPDNPGFLLTLSDIYLSMGMLDNCAESLNKALDLDPENTESMLKLSEIHLILKNYKEALENADRAIAVDKSNPLPYFMKGYTFAEAGDTVNAIKSYLEAVDRNQEYYDAYVQLGLIYSISGSQLAIDFFNNALNINPQSIEATYALAIFYQNAGDADHAIAGYNQLLVLDPQNVYANYNMGYVHLVFIGDYEQAIGYFDQALAMNPDYFEAIYNKGYCHELLGNFSTARELYNRVLEIQVNYEKAVEGLNRIYGK